MEFVLTNEKHKALVKSFWEESRKEDKVSDKLYELGLMAVEGDVGEMLYRSLGLVQAITPEEVKAADEFADEFLYGEDFETFYEKWYGGCNG